jgi:hypothetical protein
LNEGETDMNQRHDEQKQIIHMYQNLYQARTNIVEDEEGDWVTDIYSILSKWRNNFSQPLNVHGVKGVRQVEVHTAEQRVPESSAFEVEMAIEKLKRHKSPSTDQIPADLIEGVCRKIPSEIHELINSIWMTEGLSEEWRESAIVPIYRIDDKTGISLCQQRKNFIRTASCRG